MHQDFSNFQCIGFNTKVTFLTPCRGFSSEKVAVTLLLLLLDFSILQCRDFHIKVTFLTPGRGFINIKYKVAVTLVKMHLKKMTTSDLCEIFRNGRKGNFASPQNFWV